MATRDNRLDEGAHRCHMFRWSEIEAMIARLPCALIGASVSNFLSAPVPVRSTAGTPARS